jgi:hypothetical protein
MKIRHLKLAAVLLAASVVTSSCVGSFGLFNKLAQWNKGATKWKLLNEIIFLVISPAYAVCSVVDVLVFNTIEFWSGNNPMAHKAGSTESILGSDGRYYALTYLKNGYRITNPDGVVTELIHNDSDDSWSQIKNGEAKELFRFNGDGTIKANIKGNVMDFALNEQGLYQARVAAQDGYFFAAR